MKETNPFKESIKKYLDSLAKEDLLFASAYSKEYKSIDECCNFIYQQVQKSGRNGFNDEEIYGMAVHYFDEDIIEDMDIKPINCNVVVNYSIELTEEDKKAAHEAAMKKLIDEQYALLKKKPTKKREEKVSEQMNLFGNL